ncbi:MAG: T9SS type A sorting domain-containing protein, partial [Bacteroidetes bacterium]|nr:T9SS type A sorting domain-containing protein [Bacteroidota bacterium]
MTKTDAFTVYPNPVNNELTVEFNSEALAKVRVDIYTIEGQLLLQQNTEAFVGSNKIKISTAVLPTGVYLLSIGEGNQRITKRLIITH